VPEPIPAADLAYIAAVVDTMANLRICKSSKSPLPEVQVNNGNLALLDHLGRLTGVEPMRLEREYSRHLCSQHCDGPHKHVHATYGRWHLTGARATVLLHNVRPYLRLRTADAGELLEVGLAAGWKSHAIEGMLTLGWTLPPFKSQARARADQLWKDVS